MADMQKAEDLNIQGGRRARAGWVAAHDTRAKRIDRDAPCTVAARISVLAHGRAVMLGSAESP